MNEYIISIDTVLQSDVGHVGAKAAVLGTLLRAGYPVPPGLCVTTAAFDLALQPRASEINAILKHHDLGNPAEAGSASKAIAELLTDLQVPAPVISALRKALPTINPNKDPLAVRSSATAEDGADVSFAGQYTSVLGVCSQDAVEGAIVTIWRSFFSPNALVARQGINGVDAMAVLIQPVIEAECAGVCFSVDPVQQRRDLIVINAAWGLATAVVDGSAATDTTWVRRDGFAIEANRVAEKTAQVALDPEGGLMRVPVTKERRRAACLPEPWLQRVAQFGVAAELTLGRPQDVEWAVCNRQLWLLQSRPITALPAGMTHTHHFPVQWEGEHDRRHIWTIRELSGGENRVQLPLERNHQIEVESMREETCRFMGADRNGRLAFFNGRAYFCRLPLGLTEGDFRVRRAALDDLKDRLHNQGLTAWDYWGPEAVRATERLGEFDSETAGGHALAEHLEDALAVRRRGYMLHPMCWFKPRQPYFDAFAEVSGLSGEAAERAAYQLLDGEETPLTKLVDGLYDLAFIARQNPALAALVGTPPSDVLEQLDALPEAANFRVKLDNFLAVYGERNRDGWGSEATLLTPTWREQPTQMFRLAAPYLDPRFESPATVRARAQRSRDAQVEALCDACTNQEAVAEFRRQLAYARRAITVLEYHNHYINQMAIGQLRHAVLAAANWLVARGALAAPDEVFWLYFDEIFVSLRAESTGSFAEVVAARQAENAEWEKLKAPPFVGLPEAQLPERPPLLDQVIPVASQDDAVITGLGASPGQRRGRARVVAAQVLLPDLSPGDVLVAENAGPRWTPLFPILGGLVLDEGSFGQHAAATAREYGVPAVIETRDATRRIPDGAWIIVDGTKGRVELESRRHGGTSKD